MISKQSRSNIRTFRKRKYFNIGLVIFGIIFIYLIITVVMYLTAPHITPYEVRQGSILKDTAYTGLAVRSETIVHTDNSGYINYFTQDNSKVRKGSNVYTLSSEKLSFEQSATEESLALSHEQQHSLVLKIQSFCENFHNTSFSDAYLLKEDIKHTLQDITSQSRMDQLNQSLSDGTLAGVTIYPSTDDGVIAYYTDGMETLTVDTVTPTHLNTDNYKKTEFKNNVQIAAGVPAYKLITDDAWSLIIEVTEETAHALKDKKYIKVRFEKDNQSLWADLALRESEGKTLACLSFEHSMIRYINERYLDIELILEDQSGLKIPKTSKTSKDFFLVPKSYITQGGNSLSQGVLRQTSDKNGNSITEFLPVNIYFEDEETVYLDPNVFQKGDILVKPESTETYSLNEKRALDGVYQINKGYALFKQIHILSESDEYYIIEEGNSYGLSNYDRIALNSAKIKENDIVF